MKENFISPVKSKKEKLIIRKCHKCGTLSESHTEQQKCTDCGKPFLPLNYFDKIHSHGESKYNELFSPSYELEESDLIKGIYVLW